jgi:hypothetical protein
MTIKNPLRNNCCFSNIEIHSEQCKKRVVEMGGFLSADLYEMEKW